MLKKHAALMLMMLALPTSEAQQTHKCTTADGRLSFQDKPCAGDAKKPEALSLYTGNVRSSASNPSSAPWLCNTDAWKRYEPVSSRHAQNASGEERNENAFNKALAKIYNDPARAKQKRMIEATLQQSKHKVLGSRIIQFFDSNENFHQCYFERGRLPGEIIHTADGKFYFTVDGRMTQGNPFNSMKLVASCAKIISDCADNVVYSLDQCTNKANVCPTTDPIMNGYDCCLHRCISRYNDLRKSDFTPQEAFGFTFLLYSNRRDTEYPTSCLESLLSDPY